MKKGEIKKRSSGQNLPEFELMSFAMNKIHEAVYLIDKKARFHYANENACQVLGYTWDELLNLTVADIDPDFPVKRWTGHWNDLKSNGSLMFEGNHKAKDGRIFPVEINANYFEFEGQSFNLALVREITERKRTDEIQHRMNRELRAISNCNQTLLRVVDEQTLLSEICRIICDEAGYRLAWVGFAMNDEAKTIQPVAWAGFNSGYIESTKLSWSEETERGLGPAGMVVRTGEMIFIQDFATDPRMVPWRESALQHGYRSGIALPLKDGNAKVFGVLLIYSSEKVAITADEIRLLKELSGDLAYGIVSIRTQMERNRAEEALKEQYSTLHSIIDSTDALIFSLDRQYRYTSFNHGHASVMKAIYGVEIEVGQSLLDYMTVVEDREKAKSNLDRALAGEKVIEEAYSGEELWSRRYFQVSHSPVITIKNTIIGVAVLAQDMTLRKHAEENLRKEIERGNILLELYNKAQQLFDKQLYNYALDQVILLTNSTIGFFHLVSDDQKNIILTIWNSEALKNCTAPYDTQYSIEKAGNWVDCVRFKRPVIYNDFINSPNRKGFPEGHSPVHRFMSIPVMEGDKVRIIFGVGNKIEEYDDNDVVHIQLVANELQKIINQRHAEEALRVSEERYRLIAENTVDTITVLDLNLNITYVSPSVLKLRGYSAEETITQSLDQVFTPASLQKVNKLFADQMDLEASGKADPMRTEILELEEYCKDGSTIWVETTLSFIRDVNLNPTRILTVTRDITGRKYMEMDLLEAKEKAEEMSRLKSSLLLNMSHEIRTPMNGILGFTSLLKEQPLDPDSLKMVDTISSSGRRLMTTLNSILDLAQVEAGKQNLQITPVQLSEIISRIQPSYIQHAKNKNLQFISKIEENMYSLLDERLLENVLQHLLDNAIKFTDSGSISLILRKDELQGKAFATIIIKDSGIGIPSDKMNMIFEAFRQGSEGMGRSFEGTGLGLTLCKKFVGLLNGVITVESVPDVGSTFTVRFSLYNPTAEELISKPITAKVQEKKETLEFQKGGKKPYVLIVEDNEQNCELIEIYLRSLCQTDTVYSGKQAVKHAFMNQYDLILMDINLGPEMDGIQATKEIRTLEHYKNVPIIAVTGFSTAEEKAKIFSGGLDKLLSKPFTREELVTLIKHVIHYHQRGI